LRNSVRVVRCGALRNTIVYISSLGDFRLCRYYKLFALLYYMVGGLADVIMVNSTWTKRHIDELWQLPASSTIDNAGDDYKPVDTISNAVLRMFGFGIRPASRCVYPPCDTQALSMLPIDYFASSQSDDESAAPVATARKRFILSVGQFRPEKDHPLQLRAFAELVRKGTC
jgi:alpha-1,2-mannosyltransferase